MATPFQSALLKARKRRAAAALPPLGSFDPSILLQYEANKRASEHAQQTYDLGQAQAQDNFGIQTGRVDQSSGNSLADLAQSRSRNLADLLTGRTRTAEDYATATGDINRNYGVLATHQAEAARQAHVEGPGILAQSLRARQANQALDQGRLNTNFQRAQADSATGEQRLSEDYSRGVTRTGEAASNAKADLALQLARAYGSGVGGQPLGSNTLGLTQAQQDALLGNLDLSGVAYQQAAAAGYRLPSRKRRVPTVV